MATSRPSDILNDLDRSEKRSLAGIVAVSTTLPGLKLLMSALGMYPSASAVSTASISMSFQLLIKGASRRWSLPAMCYEGICSPSSIASPTTHHLKTTIFLWRGHGFFAELLYHTVQGRSNNLAYRQRIE